MVSDNKVDGVSIIRPEEDLLGPKVTLPQIWGSAEIPRGLGVFLDILS